MFIKEIETSIKQKNTKSFLNIIKKLSVKDVLTTDQAGLSVICSKTPLQLASDNQNDRVTKFLIDRGAEITENEIEKMSKNFKNNPFFLSYLNELTE